LVGIPPAPRGIPQIEVTFDIDANGIVHVGAKDLGTQKEQSIKITAGQKLSDEEIEKMRKDAELHAEEDKKRKDQVEVINEAETLVYSTEKLFEEFKDKVPEDKIKDAKVLVDELKELLKPEEKDAAAIKAKVEEVNKKVQAISTELYQKVAQEQQAAQQAQQSADPSAKDSAQEKPKKKKEKVVDADYEVNKKEEKK